MTTTFDCTAVLVGNPNLARVILAIESLDNLEVFGAEGAPVHVVARMVHRGRSTSLEIQSRSSFVSTLLLSQDKEEIWAASKGCLRTLACDALVQAAKRVKRYDKEGRMLPIAREDLL